MVVIISVIDKGYFTKLVCVACLTVDQRGQGMKDKVGFLSLFFFLFQNYLRVIFKRFN